MQSTHAQARQEEAEARQLIAEVQQGASLQQYGGPDRRELSLGLQLDGALRAFASLLRVEQGQRQAIARGTAAFCLDTHQALRRAAGLHLELARRLTEHLDQACNDGLSVRNALAFRRHYAELLARAQMDHGHLPTHIQALAQAAVEARTRGQVDNLSSGDPGVAVESRRTWDFIKRTAALSSEIQELAAGQYRRYFPGDDRHPLFAGRPLPERQAKEGLWLVEISFAVRALALVTEAEPGPRAYTWFWIGDAKDWCGAGF